MTWRVLVWTESHLRMALSPWMGISLKAYTDKINLSWPLTRSRARPLLRGSSHRGDSLRAHRRYVSPVFTFVCVGGVEICTHGHCWFWFPMDLISKEKATGSYFLQSLKFSGRLSKSIVDIIRISESSKKKKATIWLLKYRTYIYVPALSLVPSWLFYDAGPLTWKESSDKASLIRQLGCLGEYWPK